MGTREDSCDMARRHIAVHGSCRPTASPEVGAMQGAASFREGRSARTYTRRWYLRATLGLLLLLAIFVCQAGTSTADVDTMGQLRPLTTTTQAPGTVEPLVTSISEDYECTAKYSDVQSGAFLWVIGNCPKGTKLEAVVLRLHSDSEPEGDYALGGFVGGEVQGCGWIEEDKFKPKALKSKPTVPCSEIAGGTYEISTSSFMATHNSGTGDGYFVVNPVACPEYANYRPWSTNNVEQEYIRTEPAYATSSGNVPALKWRYTTKYKSTDGTGAYVMVRDASIADGEGNWVFVPRSCLPSTLPENESERNPPPPTVATGGASSIETKGASLHGTVNPNGLDAKYHFDYGTTVSYGSSTPEGDAGAGTGSVEESAAITGLASYTTYYYRIVATSAIGTSFGSAGSFTTQAVPPTVTTGAATVQFRRATLNGTVNPNGAPTAYYYQYGRTTSYGSVTSEGSAGSGSAPVSAPITATGLEPGTTYHYRLVAINPGGTSYGADEKFTTATPPTLSISNRLQASMTLTWTASVNASSYTIKRDGGTIGTTSALSYVDTKLQPTTFHYYEVVANEESESSGSNIVTRATTPLNTTRADINGDGKTDLVYIYPGGYIDTFLSKGNGTYEEKSELIEAGFNTTDGTWEVGDFNGDGKADLAYILPGGYIDTFMSKGNGLYEETIEHLTEFNSTSGKWLTGDFNGDGKTDLTYIYPGGYIDTFFSKGNGHYEEVIEHLTEFDSSSGQWFTGDFNDDGKTDLLYIYPGGYIDTFFSKGNGHYEEVSEHLKEFDSSSGQWMTGDFNDDGKTDLVYIYPVGYIDTFMSKGNGTYTGTSEYLKEFDTSSGRWRTGDVNGDGKTDLMYTYPGGYIDTFLSKGNGAYEELGEYVKEFDDVTGLWL
jgi:hypothetical protein